MKSQKKQLKKPLKPNDRLFTQNQTSQLISTKSKKNLTILDTSQAINLKNLPNKITSPKHAIMQHSMISPKNNSQINMVNSPKNQIKNNLNIKKKTIEQKFSGVKKQKTQVSRISITRNANSKFTTSQSLISNEVQSQNNQEYSNLNVDLDTSIYKQSEQKSKNQIQSVNQSQCLISQLRETSNKKEQEIISLKKQNQQLHRKLQKIKSNQQQNRKMLKNRINSFNQQGQQLKFLKNRVGQLQNTIQNAKKETSQKKLLHFQSRLYQINVFNFNEAKSQNTQQIQNFKQEVSKEMVDQTVMTSPFQDSFSEGVLSFLNNHSGHSYSQESKREQSQSFLNLQLQKIKIKYQQKYTQKVQKLTNFYNQNLRDVEERYKLLIQQVKQITKQQADQIFSLQKQLDTLYQKLDPQNCNQEKDLNNNCRVKLTQNEKQLKNQIYINQLKQKLSQKKQELQSSHESHKLNQIQYKKIQAQLDLQRIKTNLNLQRNLNKIQILKVEQSEQLQLIKEELKNQKQKNGKLQMGLEQKEDIIKKLAELNKKKYVGRK